MRHTWPCISSWDSIPWQMILIYSVTTTMPSPWSYGCRDQKPSTTTIIWELDKQHSCFNQLPRSQGAHLLSKCKKGDWRWRWLAAVTRQFKGYRINNRWGASVQNTVCPYQSVRVCNCAECFTFRAGDNDVVLGAFILSLMDKISFSQQAVPCRGRSCKHHETFDLRSSYVVLNKSISKKTNSKSEKCPLCKVSCSIEFIQVDELVLRGFLLFQICAKRNYELSVSTLEYSVPSGSDEGACNEQDFIEILDSDDDDEVSHYQYQQTPAIVEQHISDTWIFRD